MTEVPKLKMTSCELMEVTGAGSVRANVRISFNNALRINGVKIIEGKEGLFVSWPARKIGEKWIPFITYTHDAADAFTKLNAYLIKQYEEGNFTEKPEYNEKNYKPKSKTGSDSSKSTKKALPKSDDDNDDLPF